jgi:acyl-CoA reductase-like NAD-dependent aldehyde dehydrogenase
MGLTFDVRNPATGAVVGAVPDHGEADVAAMVAAASAAAAEWRRRPVNERIAVVEEGCRLVERHADELACEDAAGTGNPLRATRRDVATGVAGMRLMSRLVTLPRVARSLRHGRLLWRRWRRRFFRRDPAIVDPNVAAESAVSDAAAFFRRDRDTSRLLQRGHPDA